MGVGSRAVKVVNPAMGSELRLAIVEFESITGEMVCNRRKERTCRSRLLIVALSALCVILEVIEGS